MAVAQLKYGIGTIQFSLSGQVKELKVGDPEVDINKENFIDKFTTLLSEKAEVKNAAIVVADKTRLCGYETILPWIVQALHAKGLGPEQICFYIAYGTHPPQSDEESRAAYGEIFDRYTFVHHDCHDEDTFIQRGETVRGTAAKVRRDVIESDLILTVGAISHHYFAGYGGGRKLLFPGVAERSAIYANHSLFLDTEEKSLSTGCWPGNLEGNPLAADLEEIHDMLPEYLSIHALLNSKGKPAQYFFGRSYDNFLDVCRELDRYYRVDVDEQFGMVLASAGGYPKDINMIQVHKSVHNAANLVKDGGTLIILAECRDGVGSTTFLPYFRMGGRENTFAELVNAYAGNGGTALAMMEKTSRINIVMMTRLEEELCREIGVQPASQEEVQALIDKHTGSFAFISNASLFTSRRMT
ncbi:nickel-dependent lactate racemase [Desulfopila sp. IMCC35008]|uniref:nickel-dependent lactate racemase n=1 Tax=Desulfopila sp. IMCC35008 TaxID=2653858 RepID=UPI0013D065FE|nr:nickel-dependent lactate racemase [Desulfopila sp. IMCC35008]